MSIQHPQKGNGRLQAAGGILLLPLVHLPRMIWSLLSLSYAAVFHNRPNLTADPKEHLKRARRLLRRKHNSLLLYAAVEIRFALERVAQSDLYIASITNRARKQYDPVKKVEALRRAEPSSDKRHRMILVNKDTGAEVDFGAYKPLDQKRVEEIKGRLGDLLHPKVGLHLGVPNAPWYLETRGFLWESHDYLREVVKERTAFLGQAGLDDIWEIKRLDE